MLKVPLSGNSFHIETGHLHCKLICWFLFVGSFVKRFSKQVINRFLGPIDVLKLQGILAVLFHWTNSFFISFLVNKVLAQMYVMPTRNKPLIMKLMTTWKRLKHRLITEKWVSILICWRKHKKLYFHRKETNLIILILFSTAIRWKMFLPKTHSFYCLSLSPY